jgi:hypothetical protein
MQNTAKSGRLNLCVSTNEKWKWGTTKHESRATNCKLSAVHCQLFLPRHHKIRDPQQRPPEL